VLKSDGFAADRYAALRETFEGNDELGASVCVTVEGETQVDLWGGFADKARTRPWARDTIANVYSVTKTMTALTALLLADRGELEFEAPVAKYWPEFAAAGKESVLVSHLMSHSSGLAGWRAPITVDDLYDWEKATALLAAQEPFWEPGTASGYHAVTQGYLVGEVIRRITGRTVGTLFREEIAEPLQADFHIGLPASEDDRVAELIAPPERSPFTDGTELQINVSTNPQVDPAVVGTRAWRGAEIPAGNGHGNARSVAQVLALLANGGAVGDQQLLSEAGCRRALEVQVEGRDLVLDMPIRWGLGFAVNSGWLPNPNTINWGGAGGSLAVVDMDAHVTFAYVMNKMAGGTTGGERGIGLLMEALTA
jgi:CubicO group peptidase (beta-lactamase class C family)